MRIPAATYRLQFNSAFGFSDALKLVPYLHALGISDLYASPIFAARPGSAHGYDMTDPLKPNSELGTEKEFAAMVEALQEVGMGLLLDIVPNHMATAQENPWWSDVLEHGADSQYAGFFDIDWQRGEGKIVLPILSSPLREALDAGEVSIAVDEGGLCFRCGDARLPVVAASYRALLTAALARLGKEAPSSLAELIAALPGGDVEGGDGTEGLDPAQAEAKQALMDLCRRDDNVSRSLGNGLQALNSDKSEDGSATLEQALADQAYRLAYWRQGTREINYRRFFDISDLVGVRVEDPEVFEATHAFILELARLGKATGLRVDHIDGLLNPAGYLTRLQRRLAPEGDEARERSSFYVVVEKILAGGEELPAQWPVAGTTGYDFLNLVNGLFVDGQGLRALRSAYEAFVGSAGTFADTVYEQKKRMARDLFPGELQSLTTRLASIAEADPAVKGLRTEEVEEALVEVSACLPVYRTYVGGPQVSDRDKALVEHALAEARRRNPDVPERALGLLKRVLLLDTPAGLLDGQKNVWLGFVRQWQQFTGPLAAKGLEDTALYVYHPLLSLNEVGADPEGAGTVTVDEFHQRNSQVLRCWPHTMNTLATHDTKRGSDTRARINVLSELADEWSARLGSWSEENKHKKTLVDAQPVPDANEEVLLYQTLVGAWPLDEAEVPGFKERLKAYVVKAAREAKVHTSWLDVDLRHEEALVRFVDAILPASATSRFQADLLDFQQKIAYYGALNSLSQLVLEVASPGVPDVYQGTELWDLSLVDPDNRRPVDFERRQRLLEALLRQEGEDPAARVRDLVEHWPDGRIKLYVTAKTLSFRSRRPDLFREGAYFPVGVRGMRKDHVVAIARRHGGEWVVAAVPRLVTKIAEARAPVLATTDWGDTILPLPADAPRRWTSILTEKALDAHSEGGPAALPLRSVFAHAPVAVLWGNAN